MDDGEGLRLLGFFVLCSGLVASVIGFVVAKKAEYRARAAGRAKRYAIPPPLIIAGLAIIAVAIISRLPG